MKNLLFLLLFLSPVSLLAQFENIVEVEMPAPMRLAAGFSNYEIRAIPGLNSPTLDYAPSITADGEYLYFVSDRPGGVGRHDIWSVRFTGEKITDLQIGEPSALPRPINSELNEGISAISPDGRTLIFTACNRDDGVGDCDLYSAELVDGEWVNVKNLVPLNSTDWDSQPSLSGSGDTIYFVSNRPGALGGPTDADIYVAYRNEVGEWGAPVNLGNKVNTVSREDSPFIMPGTSTLYFSSKGHTGFGGLDFFRTELSSGGTWSTPENLGANFNTERDERFITGLPDGSIFFFTSQRLTPSNEGSLDIFAATNMGWVVNSQEGGAVIPRVVPNPAQNQISVSATGVKAGATGILTIYSASGQVVLVREGYQAGEQIDISGLAEGFYLVVVDNGDAGTLNTSFVRRL